MADIREVGEISRAGPQGSQDLASLWGVQCVCLKCDTSAVSEERRVCAFALSVCTQWAICMCASFYLFIYFLVDYYYEL